MGWLRKAITFLAYHSQHIMSAEGRDAALYLTALHVQF